MEEAINIINKSFLRKCYKFNKAYNCEVKRMFKYGKFNEKNYNGGDDIIRDFLYLVENKHIENTAKIVLDERDIAILVKIKYKNDQRYATITMVDIQKQTTINEYLFSWYKNRGKTEVGELNGKTITEKQYIELLKYLVLGWDCFDEYIVCKKERIDNI